MHSKNSNTDYQKLIKTARNSRYINIGLCLLASIMVCAGAFFAFSTDYRLFAVSLAVIIILVLAALTFKSLHEAKAAFLIADNAVFAALLSDTQKMRIKKYLMRRGQSFYFTAFIIVVMPESAIMAVMYYLFNNSVYLLFTAGFAVACLTIALFALLYLSARLSVGEVMLTISGRGIMVGREIISFNSEKQESLQLLRFSDYYYFKFVKSAVFGIKYASSIIIPTDGVLRKGLTGTPDEELAIALGLDDIFVTEDAFYESRSYLDEEADELETAKATYSAGEDKTNYAEANTETLQIVATPERKTYREPDLTDASAHAKPEQPAAGLESSSPAIAGLTADDVKQGKRKGFLED